MNCSNCNTEVLPHERYCSHCGSLVNVQNQTAFHNQFSNQQAYTAAKPNYDVIPPEIKKWNWGAFCFNIFWGIGNHAYLTLLCLVPFLNIVWIFVCGASGNKWAWQSGEFKSVEEFLAVQKTWNRAGLVSFIIGLAIFVLYLFMFIIVIASAAVSYLPE